MMTSVAKHSAIGVGPKKNPRAERASNNRNRVTCSVALMLYEGDALALVLEWRVAEVLPSAVFAVFD